MNVNQVNKSETFRIHRANRNIISKMLWYSYLGPDILAGFDNYKYNARDTSPLSNYVCHPFWNRYVHNAANSSLNFEILLLLYLANINVLCTGWPIR